MRSFKRFTTDIPVKIMGESGRSYSSRQLYNVSYGGVACVSDLEFKPGDTVSVRIPHVNPPFDVNGVVVWCEPNERGYELGIQFSEGREAFIARMVEQVCQIEQYRIDVFKNEGRELSGDEAAQEWIEKNAHKEEVQERAFIRHPADIPIEISRVDSNGSFSSTLRNYSLEGACFASKKEIKLGEVVQLEIPNADDDSSRTVEGVVIWCKRVVGGFDIGVRFKNDEELFKSQVLKELCRLESFRDEVRRTQGRELSGEETVKEYIAYMQEISHQQKE